MNDSSDTGSGRIHVIGAGMAGLGAAVHATLLGRAVCLWEAAGHAGGRCRSFHDATLDRLIDNGNHLILGGNRGVFRYLEDINAENALTALTPTLFPFIELPDRRQWSIRPSRGPIPFWIFLANSRVPNSRLRDYLAVGSLAAAGSNDTIADRVDTDRPIFERLWQPLARAVLNTDATEGAASLLWTMLQETVLKGARASQPFFARNGLSAAFVEPALTFLTRRDTLIMMNRRLRALTFASDGVSSIRMGGEDVPLGAKDQIILAVPPNEASDLLLNTTVPTETRPIVNLHFRVAAPIQFPFGSSIVGLVGTNAQWLFKRDDVLSVTISDAGVVATWPADRIASEVWQEIVAALELANTPVPPVRVIKEQRATIAQTPASMAQRPPTKTRWRNLFLAGDWTDTGLPATIDGALRSGYCAADMAAERLC